MSRRAALVLLTALVIGVVVLSQALASGRSPRTAALTAGRSDTAPPGLLKDLTALDRQLAALVKDERTRGLGRDELIRRVKAIEDEKLAMVDEFFTQTVYGVKFSEVFRQLDCLDQQLKLGTGIQIGNGRTAARQDLIAQTFELGKGCKEKLERELQGGGPPPTTPKVSLNTLHSFDLTPSQQGQLAVAATRPSGSDTTDPSLLNADAAIKNAYVSNGFVGRHERDYAKVGVSNPSNPDTWPQGQTVLSFVAFDLFKTAAGAAKAAEASRLDLVANDFTPITGSPLGEGEIVLQKLPAGTDVLNTIIVLRRGQVVVKIASACRGCPLGTLPADAAAFAKLQLAQADANGLPK